MPGNIELVINGTDNTGGMFESVGGGLASLAGKIATGFISLLPQITSKVIEFTGSVINEAREAQVAQAQTNAVLKSTGGIAGVTADEVAKYAQQISEASKFTDDQVQSGENMLLTFTNIGKDVFPTATQTMADMSAALGQDLSASAMQLGKALNDPIKGVSALRKVGVTLTDQQEDQVKAFMAAGDAASAQKIILDELGKEFGGSARAQANSWDLLSHKFDAAKEKLGNALLPTIDKVGDVLGKALDNPAVQGALDAFAGWIGDNAPKLLDFALSLGDAFTVMQDPLSGITNMLYRMDGISPIFDDLGETVANFGQLLDVFGAWWAKNGPPIIAQGQRIGDAINKALEQISAKLTPFIDQQLKKFEAWFTANGPLITQVVTTMANQFTAAIPFVVSFFDVIMPLLDGLTSLLMDTVTIVMQVFTGDMPGAWKTAQDAAKNLGVNITKTFTAFVNWVMSFFGTNLKAVTKVWQDNFNQLNQIITSVINIIKGNIDNGIQGMKNIFLTGVQSLIDGANNMLGSFQNFGASIINGIQTGISNNLEGLQAFLQETITNIINAALAALGLPPIGSDDGSGNEGNGLGPGQESSNLGSSGGPSSLGGLRKRQQQAAGAVGGNSTTNAPFYNFGNYYAGGDPSNGGTSLDKYKR